MTNEEKTKNIKMLKDEIEELNRDVQKVENSFIKKNIRERIRMLRDMVLRYENSLFSLGV
jgi:hypothetical protein